MWRAHAGGAEIDEYQVKAAFLFNFAKFVEWPAQAFKSADEPIGVCVLGPNPFGASLSKVVAGKVVGNRNSRCVRFATLNRPASATLSL